jgi:hypothetical protein
MEPQSWRIKVLVRFVIVCTILVNVVAPASSAYTRPSQIGSNTDSASHSRRDWVARNPYSIIWAIKAAEAPYFAALESA